MRTCLEGTWKAVEVLRSANRSCQAAVCVPHARASPARPHVHIPALRACTCACARARALALLPSPARACALAHAGRIGRMLGECVRSGPARVIYTYALCARTLAIAHALPRLKMVWLGHMYSQTMSSHTIRTHAAELQLAPGLLMARSLSQSVIDFSQGI